MTDLSNKTVVITGAANGLGKALSMAFFEQGCNLALIDIDIEALKKLEKKLSGNNQKISIHYADVANEQDIILARQQIVDKYERIHIFINNAGVSISQLFGQVDLADFKRLIDVNFWGTVYCSRYFIPDLEKQKNSRLVNIISDFALMGFPGKTTYASSKAAVMGFTNSLKTELTGTNLKVCLVIPPPLHTGIVMNGKHMDDDKKQREINFLKENGMPVDKAAKYIVAKIKKGKYRIVVGTMMFWTDLASRLFPTLMHKLIAKNKNRFDFI